MTPQEAAAALDGNQYRKEGSKALFAAMKAAGLVAVYGASDDLMEFDGAINDEIGCNNGGTAYLTKLGLLTNDCGKDCPYFATKTEAAATIEAKWDERGFSWVYETEIPHVKFVIKEDDENYCEGIVFALADVEEQRSALDVNGARAAAEAIADYADNNLSMFEACCEDDPVKAREVFEAAKRLRDLLGPLRSAAQSKDANK